MYDLVIIGASPEGLRAARRGITKFQTARIALITQGWEKIWAEKDQTPTVNPSSLINADPLESLRQLAALGIDVILEAGEFHQTETGLRWSTPQRQLTARSYLLTTDSERYRETQNISLPFALSNPTQHFSEAKTWGIWGASPQNLVLAQGLAQQGHSVHLFTRNAHLLPGEDREIVHLLQGYWESLGIQIWGNCPSVTPHFQGDSQTYQLLIKNGIKSQTITVDGFWRSPLPTLPWHWLKRLEDFGPEIESNSPYIRVNAWLKTINSQIYACGGWLKGYARPETALQEAHYVVDRVLGETQGAINYSDIPFGIDLDPPWYRLGLSEERAIEQGENIQVYYGYEPYHGDCPLRGFCKLITSQSNKILGAQWFGPSAKAGISLLTPAIAAELTLEALQDLPLVERRVAQVLRDLSQR